MRLAIVQYGDYREAHHRLRVGGDETYNAQRYSVDFVASLSRRTRLLGVCSALGEGHVEELEPGLWSACVPLKAGRLDVKSICAQLERWQTTHLILSTPSLGVLKWALDRGVASLPVLADSFCSKGPLSRFNAFRLAQLLNRPEITLVGNHNLPASLSLKRIGVNPRKIYPWDWPAMLTPEMYAPKRLPEGPAHLVFVGAMTLAKGPGDCLAAAELLRDAGVDFTMSLIGGGPYEAEARARAAALEVDDRVTVKGQLPHREVVAALAGATLSFVVTHHAYAEGLPMTIYESLATRTPLVMSDHPMFRYFFANASPVKLIPEKSPAALEKAVVEWLSDREGYRAASIETDELWKRIQCDLTWGQLLEAWLDNPKSPHSALQGLSLRDRLAAPA